jgi:hypothetical protein
MNARTRFILQAQDGYLRCTRFSCELRQIRDTLRHTKLAGLGSSALIRTDPHSAKRMRCWLSARSHGLRRTDVVGFVGSGRGGRTISPAPRFTPLFAFSRGEILGPSNTNARRCAAQHLAERHGDVVSAVRKSEAGGGLAVAAGRAVAESAEDAY